MFSFLKPYTLVIQIGIVALLLGTIALLKISNLNKDLDISQKDASIGTLTTANASLFKSLTDERAERARVDGVEQGTVEVRTVIETQYIEVTKDVIVYRESPAAKRCTLDPSWVHIYDKSTQLTSRLSENGNTGNLQQSAGGLRDPFTISEKELSALSVNLSDALDVITRNNKRYLDLNNLYNGLYEICAGKPLKKGG